MADFDTRRREEPNEPNSRPRSPAMAGRALNPLIAILRLAPIASYALAQIIVVGFCAYGVSVYYRAGTIYDYAPALPGPFQYDTPAMIYLTAIVALPFGAVLGALDAAAHRSSRPLVQVLLLVLDALLIVYFALVLIGGVEWHWLFLESCSKDDRVCSNNTPSWPEWIGALIGEELGLVMLVLVSMRLRRY
jgi:hypothetical protein